MKTDLHLRTAQSILCIQRALFKFIKFLLKNQMTAFDFFSKMPRCPSYIKINQNGQLTIFLTSYGKTDFIEGKFQSLGIMPRDIYVYFVFTIKDLASSSCLIPVPSYLSLLDPVPSRLIFSFLLGMSTFTLYTWLLICF